MRYLMLFLGTVAWAGSAGAAIRTETVDYRQGETRLEGYLAYDDSAAGKRPGVLVVHEWWGINDYVRSRAEQLARQGYVAFAADMYGKGIRAGTAAEAGKLAGALKADRALMRARADAALDVLKRSPLVDPARIAAVGYCFGGTTVLEMARAGTAVAGVVSFHGGLDTPHPEETRSVKTRVLALHGGDDPFVPPAQVAAFQEEMRGAGADWQLVAYGGAVHSFTNPAAGSDKTKGSAYDERADRRSWEAMTVFFREIFK